MLDSQKILVPDVGGDEVEVIEICFAVGDTLEADEGIITVETDKASMDIPAPFSGEIIALNVTVGDKIKEGDVIAEMKSVENNLTSDTALVSEAELKSTPQIPTPQMPTQTTEERQHSTEAENINDNVASVPTSGSEVIDVVVPDIGEDGEVDVIDVLVAVGDEIAEEDGLITLETDKATMDVPSTHAGIVKEVLIATGDKIKQGALVIKLETNSGAPAAIEQPVASAPVKSEPQTTPTLTASPAEKKSAPVPHHPSLYLFYCSFLHFYRHNNLFHC
jgi:pyruvate dehydrogenase E2 component (dihydrolipoamide acetyltransferase)